MEIYDISQEVFGCDIFPGDPGPHRETLSSIAEGAACNLTAFDMCAHNGTHVDAPYHFYNDGKTIDQVELDRFIGYAYVAEHDGDITENDARDIMRAAKEADPRPAERILIKGKATLTRAAAEVFAAERI